MLIKISFLTEAGKKNLNIVDKKNHKLRAVRRRLAGEKRGIP
jgi:hypothetical protein